VLAQHGYDPVDGRRPMAAPDIFRKEAKKALLPEQILFVVIWAEHGGTGCIISLRTMSWCWMSWKKRWA